VAVGGTPSAFVADLHGTNGAAGVERVNYDGTVGLLGVLTGNGNDRVTLDGNLAPTLVVGGSGNDTFQVGQLFASPRNAGAGVANPFPTTQTTRGFVSDGVDYATAILGGSGSNTFTVLHNAAPLALIGGTGSNVYDVRSLATGLVPLTRSISVPVYLQNAPLGILGRGTGNVVNITGTEFADTFAVSATSVVGAGLDVFYSGVQQLNLDMAEGNDVVNVAGTAAGTVTTIDGGSGNDTFHVGTPPGTVATPLNGTLHLPPHAHGIAGLNGPLNLVGGGGSGSAQGFGAPVMLPGETNQGVALGTFLAFSASAASGGFTMRASASAFGGLAPSSLVGQTIDVVSGPGQGSFYLVTSAAAGPNGTVVLGLRAPTLPDPNVLLPTSASAFALGHDSATFFAPAGGTDLVYFGGTAAAASPLALQAAVQGGATFATGLPPIITGNVPDPGNAGPWQGLVASTGLLAGTGNGDQGRRPDWEDEDDAPAVNPFGLLSSLGNASIFQAGVTGFERLDQET